MRRFTAEGVTVVHAGDLGHQPTAEQAASIGPCDVLLLPVGGTFTLDAREAKKAAEALRPRVIVPMHYRDGQRGFVELTPLEDFTGLYPPELVRRYPGNTLRLEPDMPRQVAVLTLS